MITLQEIKEATCGEDISGKSKAISVIGAHKYNMSNTAEEPQKIAEFGSTEPIVSIVIKGDLTWISLKFISEKSDMLSLFFRTLERYLEESDNDNMDTEAIAFLTLLPLELGGQYYITAMRPIFWALEPESVGEDMRTLRMVFFSEDVSFLESDFDDDFFEGAKALAESSEADSSYDDDTDDDTDYDYSRASRNAEFTDGDRYFADFDDDDDDEENDEDDEDEKDDTPPDRSSYVYR